MVVLPHNKALKLTRLSACLLGGSTFGEDRAVQRPYPSSAVQLNAGVRRLLRQSRRRISTNLAAALALLLLTSCVTPASQQPALPVIAVTGPTIVAFFPDVSQNEIDGDFDLDTTLEDFQRSARGIRAFANTNSISFHELYSHAFLIRTRGLTIRFEALADSGGIGYYLTAPGMEPLVLYGVHTDSDVASTASGYFGRS